MKFMLNFKRFTSVLFIVFISVSLSSCFMMPFMIGPMFNKGTPNTATSDVSEVLKDLVQESVDALIVNRGSYERILLGKTETRDSLIPAQKLRMMILQTLRSTNAVQVYDRDDRPVNTELERFPPESKRDTGLAMLNVQLFQASEQIWLAQQLVDIPTKQHVWSGIFSKPMSGGPPNGKIVSERPPLWPR